MVRASIDPVALVTPPDTKQTPVHDVGLKVVGSRVIRSDIRTHVVGTTRYVDDLRFPGMLYAAILRSGHAHARILGVDVAGAARMPGVVATLTGNEVPVNSFGVTFHDQPVLAIDRVRHRGDPVVAVAAETEQQAQDALACVRVEYEPLPAVFDPLEAMEPGAPRIHGESNVYMTKVLRKGNVEHGLAQSDRIFEGRYRTQMMEHAALEPHVCVAVWEPDGQLHVYSSLGRITKGRADIARVLGLPMTRVRVTATLVGGNFGGKNEITMEPIVALLARKAGRPVKGRYRREEEFAASTTRHPVVMWYKTGVTTDGRLLARRVRLVLDGGAYASWSETTLAKATILAAGPYRIPHLDVEGLAVYTNKTMTGAMRGFGAPQVCFGYESQMDEISQALGIDPVEIRLRNIFREGSLSHTGQVLHAVGLEETLLTAARRHAREERSR